MFKPRSMDNDIDSYYKKLSNPVATVSKCQKTMVDMYQIDIDRQKKSQTKRKQILAEKRRSRINAIRGIPSSDSDTNSIAESIQECDDSESDFHNSSVSSSPQARVSPARLSPARLSPARMQRLSPARLSPERMPQEQLSQPNLNPQPISRPTIGSASPSSVDSIDDIDALYAEELDARLADMGVHAESPDNTKTPTTNRRSQELSYWRKKVSLEEEAAVKQAGMLLSLLSSFVESFTNAVGFTTIKTQGLSEAIQDALESGDFDLAIKSYCVSPHALNMLKNPVTSFMTSFGHVVLRTHIVNVKRELQEGIDDFKRRKREEHDRETQRAAAQTHVPQTRIPPIVPNGVGYKPPWSVPPINRVTDSTGNHRPMFELPDETPQSKNIGLTFRDQVSKITPVLGALHKISTLGGNNSTPTPTDIGLSPGTLDFQ